MRFVASAPKAKPIWLSVFTRYGAGPGSCSSREIMLEPNVDQHIHVGYELKTENTCFELKSKAHGVRRPPLPGSTSGWSNGVVHA